MEAIALFFKKLSLLVHREKFASELDEEMAFHREQAERELAEDGADPEAAHYAAVKQFGNASRVQEDSVETVGFRFESVLKDLRYAARQLRHNPGFTATAMLVLAIGIGATTAIFSAVNPILFKALPYPEASRVAMIWEMRDKGAQMAVTFGSFHGLSERQRSFEALAVMKPWQPSMAGDAQPERFEGQRVSTEYFRVLGILPVLGRSFETADDQYRGPNVVVLSDRLWRRRFGSDGSIVGRQVKLDDNLFTVIGVMPAGFENVLAPTAEIWAPLQYNPALPLDSREWGHHLRMIGRLRDGVSLEQAKSELDVILHALGQIYAKGYDGSGGVPNGFIVNSMQSDVTRGRETSAAGSAGRGVAGAGDCVRERDELAAGTRGAASWRVCGEGRTGGVARKADATTAAGESAADCSWRRAGNDSGRGWSAGTGGAESGGAAAGGCDSAGWPRVSVWARHRDGDWAGSGNGSGAASVAA